LSVAENYVCIAQRYLIYQSKKGVPWYPVVNGKPRHAGKLTKIGRKHTTIILSIYPFNNPFFFLFVTSGPEHQQPL